MLDTAALRQALIDIYGIPEKYIVPMDAGYYVPTHNKDDKVGTWIGYRILSVKPNLRAGYTGSSYEKNVKIQFRLSFVGKQAEELALQTLLFDDRIDVIKVFEKTGTQLNYTSRSILTYPIREGGLNDSLCWFVDMECQSYYAHSVQYGEWEVEGSDPPDSWLPSKPEGKTDASSLKLSSGTMSIHR